MGNRDSTNCALEKSFLDSQEERLYKLIDELIGVADGAAVEEQTIQGEADGEAHERGDAASRSAIQENDEALYAHNLKRLAQAQRALQRLNQGTYGYSEQSGDPISKARLMVIPEATLTYDEEHGDEGGAAASID